MKEIRKFYVHSFLVGLSAIANTYIFLYLSRDLGLAYTAISIIVFAAFFIGQMLFEIPSGIFADVYGRKKSTILGVSIGAIVLLIIPFVKATIILAGLFFLMGIGTAFISGAYDAWAVDNLKHHRQSKLIQGFYAKRHLLMFIGAVIAPLIAAGLASVFELRWLFIADATLYMLAILPLLATHEHRHKAKHEYAKSAIRITKESFQTIRKNRTLRMLFYATMLSVVTFSAETGWQPLLAWTLLPIAGIGILTSGQNILRAIAMAISTKITKQHHEAKTLAILSIFQLGLAAILLFAEPGKWIWAAIAFLGIAVLALSEPAFFALQQRHIASKIRATATSFFSLAKSIIGAIGMIAGGILLDAVGPKLGIIIVTMFALPEAIIYLRIENKS